MKKFMDEDFLLKTETAKHLYHDYAENLPIIDYHCHLSPKEIAEDVHFKNITEVWLGGDHYKWRQMRSMGIEEKYITGDGSDYEKFLAFAKTLEMAIGNPLYHWSHLELKTYFGYDGVLNERTAPEVWEICNEKLKGMSARQLILDSTVEMLATTDDPIDDLKYHKMIKEDESFNVKVLPAFRPDKAVYIEKPTFKKYIEDLTKASSVDISDINTLKDALVKRMDFFGEMGCSVADHGLAYVPCNLASEKEVDEILKKRLSGGEVTADEVSKYTTYMLLFFGRQYAARNWVMQLHFGVKRDNDVKRFETLGPDCGVDCIGASADMTQLADFLNELQYTNELPKTIVYSLNPNDNAAIGTIIGCFQDSSAVGKIQHGSAWWFNDNKTGMEQQMISLANLGLLGNFVGMLTDSRSFLSYTRHEYFRRIACNLIGQWVEDGEYPCDEQSLEKIVKGISYVNAKRYFEI